jgi:L-alanine-DL-glutamate epimerase-like enolase superfamily enzyme
MKVRILGGDLHRLDLKTRMPFKYGIATMTETPHVFMRVYVMVGGWPITGIAADHLPPKWFTKEPARAIDDEVAEMLRVVEHALEASVGLEGDCPFDVWQQVVRQQSQWGTEQRLPPLLTQFGASLVERAMLDAACRSLNEPLWRVLRKNGLGIRLWDFPSLPRDSSLATLLPKQPLPSVWARHTVGLADPLDDTDIPFAERLRDGLPQSLAACIKAYGLRHFKIKVTGEGERDRDRLRRIAGILTALATPTFAFSLDGNEAFRSGEAFRSYWESIRADGELAPFWKHLLFVEQPLHREVALAQRLARDEYDWLDRPPIIMDESDAELGSLSQALTLGYDGTSHKNCKGVIKSIANSCLLGFLAPESSDYRIRGALVAAPLVTAKFPQRDRDRPVILSGEDLANIGPVALLQDLAVCAALGIESVERNGHHYFAGLSMFPEAVQDAMLDVHPDLYHESPHGWPTLTIRDGRVSLDSINRAPFGVGPLIDVEKFAHRHATFGRRA